MLPRAATFQYLSDLAYADDAALVADTLVALRSKALSFDGHTRAWGIKISAEKTKAMTSERRAHAGIHVGPSSI